MREAIELITVGGDVLHGTRLTAQEIVRLRTRAAELVPLPDPKAYEQPMNDLALFEGDVLPAEEHPDYKRDKALALKRRQNAMSEMTIAAAWRPLGTDGKPMTRAQVLGEYAGEIEHKRAAGIVLAEDDYVAALYLGWLRTPEDLVQATVLPIQSLPVDESEVREGVKFFRRRVQRYESRRADREARASGADAESESAAQDEQPVQRDPDDALVELARHD